MGLEAERPDLDDNNFHFVQLEIRNFQKQAN